MMMAAFPGGEPPPTEPEPPEELRAYTLAEHMVGEEYALLQIPHDDRSPEQQARLGVLGRELDRLRDLLRARADALGRP
jgi:hypothetical protein